MLSDEFPAFTPSTFFALKCDCHYWNGKGALSKKHELPNTAELCGEELFATVAMGWNEEGISLEVTVHKALEQAFYPGLERGDAVELFFDTRNMKNAGFNTRFCHHFFFLPEAVDGKRAGEITRFRTEDTHPLCDEADLKVSCKESRKEYVVQIFLPAHCLVGYDPEQFDRLGFTYRIHRLGGGPQHFAVTSTEYAIDQQPSLWSSVTLVPAP